MAYLAILNSTRQADWTSTSNSYQDPNDHKNLLTLVWIMIKRLEINIPRAAQACRA